MLIHRRLAKRIAFGDVDGAGGVRSVEVCADFLGQAFSAFVDSAAAHDLHVGATIHFAQVINQLADGGHAAGERAEENENIGPHFPDEFEHFIVGDAAAGKADGVAARFEEISADLPAQFLGLIIAAEDEDGLAIVRLARQEAGELVGDAAIEAGGEIELGDGDAIFAIHALKNFHGGPDQIGEQVAWRDALVEGGFDEIAGGEAVADEELFIVGLRKLLSRENRVAFHW